MLAVAGGAWALFGRDTKKTDAASIGPKVPTATAPQNPVGPRVPGTTPKAVKQTPTTAPTQAPVAATTAATPRATPAPTATSSPAPVATPSPTSSQPAAPVTAPKPVAKPPVTAPQQGGTVAKAAYTFKVARGDTLWDLTKATLAKTGRSTSNANVDRYVAKLYSANRATIGSDPDLILIGSTITWPAGL